MMGLHGHGLTIISYGHAQSYSSLVMDVNTVRPLPNVLLVQVHCLSTPLLSSLCSSYSSLHNEWSKLQLVTLI